MNCVMSGKTLAILVAVVLALVAIQSADAHLRGLTERLKRKMHRNGRYSSAFAQTVGFGHASAEAGAEFGHHHHHGHHHHGHHGGLGHVGHEIAELGHELKHELKEELGHHGHHGYGYGLGYGYGHGLGYGHGYGHGGYRHRRRGLGALLSNRGRRVARRMGLMGHGYGHHGLGYGYGHHGYGHHGYYGHHSPVEDLAEMAVAATGGLHGHHGYGLGYGHHGYGYGPSYYGHSYHSYGPYGLGSELRHGMHHLGGEMEYGLNRFGDDLAYAGARAHLGVRHAHHGIGDRIRHGLHELGDGLGYHGMKAHHGFDHALYGHGGVNGIEHGLDHLKHFGKHLKHEIKDGLKHGKHELEYGLDRVGLEAEHGMNRLENDIYRHGHYGGMYEPYGHGGYGRYSYGAPKAKDGVISAADNELEKKSLKQTSEKITEKEQGHETDDKYTRESNLDKHDNENMHVAYNKNKEDVQGSPNYYRSKKVGEQYVQDYNKNSRTNANDVTAKDRHTQAYDNTVNKSVDLVDSKTTKAKNGAMLESVNDSSRRSYNDEDRRRYDSHPMGSRI